MRRSLPGTLAESRPRCTLARMDRCRERVLSLNVVITADAARGPRDMIYTADVVVDAKSGCMLKNRFGACDNDLARDLVRNFAAFFATTSCPKNRCFNCFMERLRRRLLRR